MFVGEVLAIDGAADKPPPLLFHAGRYGTVATKVIEAEALAPGQS